MAQYFCANKKRVVFYNKKRHIETLARLMNKKIGYIRQLLKETEYDKIVQRH